MGLDWSKEQNLKTLARQQAKRAAEEAKTREQQDAIRNREIERMASRLKERVNDSTNPEAAVRAFVEGEVYTYESDARDASDAIVELRFRRDQARTELAILRPAFENAWRARTAAVQSGQAAAGMSKRAKVSQQSRVQLVVTVCVLIALETLFQRRPLELLVRNQLPEASSEVVRWAAIACSIGIVAISTFILLFAAKAWGEYGARLANADSVLDAERQVVVERVSPAEALTATAVAIVVQVGLFFLRFQTGTSDSSARTTLIIGSALIMFCAAGVAFMEYRIAYRRVVMSKRDKGEGEVIIDNYLRLHRQVEGDIPREIADAERREQQAIARFLRDLQRLGEIGGEPVRDALGVLISETQARSRAIKDPEYELPEIVRGSEDGGAAARRSHAREEAVRTEEPRLHAVNDDADLT